MAVLPDGGVVLVDRDTGAYLVGSDGSKSSAIPLDVVPSAIVATPGPVVYGLAPGPSGEGLSMVAVALQGANAGHVVATQPLADPGQYVELPVGAFGNTPAGVVDRLRNPGSVMVGHVDVNGAPTTVDDLRGIFTIGQDNVVRDEDNPDRDWELTIERHPESREPFSGESPPAPTINGGAVYWTTIGPPAVPADEFSAGTLPVVAVLDQGGPGMWHSIPEDWALVASDTGGTVFARRSGDTVELARLDRALVDPCPTYEPNDRYPLRICDEGAAVRLAQEALKATVAPDLEPDGYFGPLTERAVREFQEQNSLAVDGLIGSDTWAALTSGRTDGTDALGAGVAVGTDADGSGVIDPWELSASTPEPEPTEPGFPPPNENLSQGGETWAVVLAASADMEDPILQEAVIAAAGAGYATGLTDCDRGAADALGVSSEIVYTVSVYYANEADARAAQAAFAGRGIAGVAAVVQTFCLD